MRHLLLVLGLLVGSVIAQDTGPPLHLNIPPHGSFPWDTQPNGGVNANWSILNSAFANVGGLGCSTATIPGTDIGAKINACDAQIGSSFGEIVAIGGGALGTVAVVSSNHTLRLTPGKYTNAFGDRAPAIRLQDHSHLICEEGAILEQSSNPAQATPVTVAAYNVGPTVNTITAAVADVTVEGCHFTQGSTANNSPFIGIVTLGNSVNFKINNNWFDGVSSIGVLIGGTSTNGFFADTGEVAGNTWNGGGVNVPLALINGRNVMIHNNMFKAPGPGAAAPIDLEPNASTDYSEDIDVSSNIIDASAATTTTYGLTVQGNAGTHINRQIKIHDNIFYGASLTSGVFMNQAIAIGPGNANTFNDFEVYNNYIYKAAADGIALNGVNRAWVHDNHFFCITTIQGAGVPSVIQLSGNDTNNQIWNNYNINDGSCPGANSTNAYGESGSGNSGNIFKGNSSPFPTTVSGSGSLIKDTIIGTCTLGTNCSAIPWANTYATAPLCQCTDTTSANACRVQSTTGSLTITGTGTDVINWSCSQ